MMLYIVYKDYSVTKFLLEPLLKKENITLIEVGDMRFNFSERVIYFIERKFSLNIRPESRYSKENLLNLNRVEKKDKVLLFDFTQFIDVKYISSLVKTVSVSLWMWNTIDRVDYGNIIKLRKTGVTIYTFDKRNAVECKIVLLNQIYRFIPLIKSELLYDFFFVGVDKGRCDELNSLGEYLMARGYRVKFIVLGLREKDYVRYSCLEIIYTSLSYWDILTIISQSKILVDITKTFQTGMTLRVLEAAFWGKKLITNNKETMNTELYNSNNVFVLNVNSLNQLREFIEKEFLYYDENILRKYSINSWIETFL